MNPAASTPALDSQLALPNTAYILPDTIPMWPPVWWTWLVLGIVILCTLSLTIYKVIQYKRNAYRRDAFKLIDGFAELDDRALLSHCQQTIRRCLITIGRDDLASLPSQALFNQLDLELAQKYQFKQLGQVFIDGAYQPDLTLEAGQKDRIIALTKHWCRRHTTHA